MDCSMPGLPVHHKLPEFTQTHVCWVSDVIQPSQSFPSPPPSIFPSIRIFSDDLALRIRWSKYWSFIFNISYSNEYSELIPLRIDWFNLLPAQGALKRLLQQQLESINSSALSLLYGPILIWKPQLWLYGPLLAKRCLLGTQQEIRQETIITFS